MSWFRPGPPTRRASRSTASLGLAWVLLLGLGGYGVAGCTAGEEDFPGGTTVAQGVDAEALAALEARLAERFTPGLHTLMVDLQQRHATLWFAGEARNWPLADYFLHELEELVEEIEELHPVYRDVPVAELLGEMTFPAMEALEEAVVAEDPEAFAAAYDLLTVACNACHIASDRAALVIVRPTAAPLTNLRYLPGRVP